MLNIVFWFVFGILIGWITALLAEGVRIIYNVAVTSLAALIGGGIAQVAAHDKLLSAYSPDSIVSAIVAACGVGLLVLVIRRRLAASDKSEL